MYLLDTNVISELRRPGRADASVRAWAKSQPATLFHLSVVTVLEIELGILLVQRRDARQAATLRTWFEAGVLQAFADRILSIDTDIARKCAALHVPDPRPERDALIAATALAHGLTIVTRNAADFRDTGAAVMNPWDKAQGDA